MCSKRRDCGNDMKNRFENEADFAMKSKNAFVSTGKSTRILLMFRAHEIYNNEMERKIKFLMRKNRVNPWPWN